MKKWLKFFTLILIIMINLNVYAQTEKQLMSSALNNINALNPELSSKNRLQIYEGTLEKINKIMEEYGDSDIGLTLKSTGKFGEFNFKKIEKDYIEELTVYYRKVCEVTPSAVCQGFSSLDSGMKICQKGGTFSELASAHKSLLNAMSIFKEQEKNQNHFIIAKSLYLQCNIKPTNIDANISNEYFKFQLIKLLIELNEGANAKGLIEQLSDPFYKFTSVTLLKKFSNEEVNNEYINRLKQYIDEKLANNGNLSNISKIVLLNLAISDKSTANVNPNDFRFRSSSTLTNQCNELLSKETFDQSFNLMRNMYQNVNGKKINQSFFKPFGNSVTEIKWIDNCGAENTIALSAIAYLYSFGKSKEAEKYYIEFSNGNFSSNKEKLIYQYLNYASDYQLAPLPTSMQLVGIDKSFAVFKQLVDIENICDASKLMFKELKNSKYQNESTQYLANKKTLTNKKYRCGDEDLELLLN